MATLDEKIEEFFDKIRDIMEKHGFIHINGEDYRYCRDGIWYMEEDFEKDGKYVDIVLKLLLDENCEPVTVKQLIIDDDNDLVSDELYDKIMDLYKKFFH